MKSIGQLIRNVASNYAEAITSGLIHILLTPVVINHLGLIGLSIWVLSQTIAYYTNFLDFRLEDAQLRVLFATAGEDSNHTSIRVVQTALVVSCGIGAAVLLLALVVSYLPLSVVFDLSDDASTELAIVAPLLITNVALNLPASVFVVFMRLIDASILPTPWKSRCRA